jgi:hypothetical protein
MRKPRVIYACSDLMGRQARETFRWCKSQICLQISYKIFSTLRIRAKSRDSSVGIALAYGLDDLGSIVRFPAGAENFSLHHRVRNGFGPIQPPIQWVPGVLSLGVKRPGREADHPSSSSGEVKNVWRFTSTPQYVFMAWWLV